MQALGLFCRRAILGRSNKSTVALEKIAKENSLNRTGAVNFNKYGQQDGIGFSPCSDKFVDNFLFYVYVPDYFVTARKKYTEVGHVNKHIRDMLTGFGFGKCEVKAVALSPLKEQPSELDKVYGRLKTKETGETAYYMQEFKISCADEEYSNVLEFLRTDEYRIRNIFLKDIDVTMDYSGSFDKDEVIHHLTTKEGFRMQGGTKDAERTILDNTDQVGNNCLTYMETVQGVTTRCKIYNKMVQMLESKSVRETVGQHWKDWVCQKNTRLAKARDLAKDRGLTRAEVTFYCADNVPRDSLMEDTLKRITQYVSPSLVYSTPFAGTWRAYCDAMLHSLVVIDRTRDVGLIVYTYNEMTKNISGQFVESWTEKEKWCLGNLTLGSKLPLDVIEVCERSKAISKTGTTETKDVYVDISGARYFKSRKDGGTDFTTRLVSKGGIYSWNEGSKEENVHLLEKAGLVAHENCTPYLAHVKGSKTCKVDMELCRADLLAIKLPVKQCNTLKGKEKNEQWKDVAGEAAKEIRESRKPFEDAITEKRKRLQILDNYSNAFSSNKIIYLKNLPLGPYNVMAMREAQTQFGEKYIMLLATDLCGTLGLCYSNKEIERSMRKNLTDEQKEKIRDPKRNYLTLFEKPLAVLNITGWGRTPQRHVIVYCNLTFAAEMEKDSIKSLREQITREIQEEKLKMACADPTRSVDSPPVLAREEMVPYKHMQNLAELPLNSTHTVVAIGHIEHYGQEKLVVKLDNGMLYQAGDNLEQQKEQLGNGCKIIINKVRVNNSTKRKFALCKVVQKGDWAGVLDYDEVPLLPAKKKRNALKVLDVKPVEHKGQKRKLLLTEDGTVYKVKRSKLENNVEAGRYV